MNTELSKNLKCIIMRSGVEMWMESDRAEVLQKMLLEITEHKFVSYENFTINTADITGIFTADVMEDKTRRKNGEWKCRWNSWHERNTKCECRNPEVVKKEKEEDELSMRTYGFRKLR